MKPHHGRSALLSQGAGIKSGSALSGAAAPTTSGEERGRAQIGWVARSGPFRGGPLGWHPRGRRRGLRTGASAGGGFSLVLCVKSRRLVQELAIAQQAKRFFAASLRPWPVSVPAQSSWSGIFAPARLPAWVGGGRAASAPSSTARCCCVIPLGPCRCPWAMQLGIGQDQRGPGYDLRLRKARRVCSLGGPPMRQPLAT